MEIRTVNENGTAIKIPVSVNEYEIEQNDFIPDAGEDTMDLKDVLELARKIKEETYLVEMEDIID